MLDPGTLRERRTDRIVKYRSSQGVARRSLTSRTALNSRALTFLSHEPPKRNTQSRLLVQREPNDSQGGNPPANRRQGIGVDTAFVSLGCAQPLSSSKGDVTQ